MQRKMYLKILILKTTKAYWKMSYLINYFLNKKYKNLLNQISMIQNIYMFKSSYA